MRLLSGGAMLAVSLHRRNLGVVRSQLFAGHHASPRLVALGKRHRSLVAACSHSKVVQACPQDTLRAPQQACWLPGAWLVPCTAWHSTGGVVQKGSGATAIAIAIAIAEHRLQCSLAHVATCFNVIASTIVVAHVHILCNQDRRIVDIFNLQAAVGVFVGVFVGVVGVTGGRKFMTTVRTVRQQFRRCTGPWSKCPGGGDPRRRS